MSWRAGLVMSCRVDRGDGRWSDGHRRGRDEPGVGPDPVEVVFRAGQVPEPRVEGDRLRETVDRRGHVARQRVVARQVVEENGLSGKRRKAPLERVDRAGQVIEPFAAPAQAEVPLSSLAKSEPIERVEPSPKPLKICPAVKTRTVRRCIDAISGCLAVWLTA